MIEVIVADLYLLSTVMSIYFLIFFVKFVLSYIMLHTQRVVNVLKSNIFDYKLWQEIIIGCVKSKVHNMSSMS